MTTPPTCQEQGYDTKTCSICGKVEIENYTAISDHDWEEEYRFDNSFHWIKCGNCTETKDSEEHDIDESGYCTVCEQPLAPTEGILYDVSADGTYAEVIGYEGTATKIVIADEYRNLPVKNIYDRAFYDKAIISVIISDSVTTIGEYAFSGCDSLTSVTIGNSVTTIGDYAFYCCYNLTSVTIGNSVTTIESCAFLCCDNLTSVTIPDSVTTIGDRAFYNCNSLTSVTMGNSVAAIEDGAFENCPDLLFTIYENVKYLGNEENLYCALIETVIDAYSSYTIHAQTKVVAESAFGSCGRLTSVYYMGDIAGWCAIEFSNGTANPLHNGAELYIDNKKLVDLVIPEVVEGINDNAFYGCISLTSVTISNKTTTIGRDAFEGCENLTSVIFEDTSTWYATEDYEDWKNKTNGWQADVSDAETAADNLRNGWRYWYKL